MSDVQAWDVNANSNTAAPPGGAPEGMVAQAFNNVIREIMAAVKRLWSMMRGVPTTVWDTGEISRHYQVTVAETITAYYTGLTFRCRMHAAHDGTTAPTLRIGSLGRITVRYAQGGPANPVFAENEIVEVIYDGGVTPAIFRWTRAATFWHGTQAEFDALSDNDKTEYMAFVITG